MKNTIETRKMRSITNALKLWDNASHPYERTKCYEAYVDGLKDAKNIVEDIIKELIDESILERRTNEQ